MRITKGQLIAGLPALALRDLFRERLRSIHREDIERLVEGSGIEAGQVLDVLVSEGYILPETSRGFFELTDLARRLSTASGSPPISRAKADALLDGLLERAAFINSNPEYTVGIVKLVVFGSYMDPARENLGDLDVAVETAIKPGLTPQDQRDQTARDMKKGKRLSYIQSLFWPSEKTLKFLKGGQRGISLVDEPHHREMLKQGPTKTYDF